MRCIYIFLLTLTLGTFLSVDVARAVSIEGTWNGGGTVKLTSGGVEKVRCRMRYEKGTGRTFVIHVTCSHANSKFSVSGRIV